MLQITILGVGAGGGFPQLGLGSKTTSRMGHMSVRGVGVSIASFKLLHVTRKICIHINNSNPILVADSPERKVIEAEGWRSDVPAGRIIVHMGVRGHPCPRRCIA
jgi:phosphoribosyl 1,2-cyclic phosphodiesterase